MTRLPAPAKINLALVVGPLRDDGKHEVATVLQRIDLADRVELEPRRRARASTASRATRSSAARSSARARRGVEPRWRARSTKRIPVAAGLGGGSSDAAAALAARERDAATSRSRPRQLHELAAALGADVPFFLDDGPQLGAGDGTS